VRILHDHLLYQSFLFIFFSTDPAPTDIYTLSLHDALPICQTHISRFVVVRVANLKHRAVIIYSEIQAETDGVVCPSLKNTKTHRSEEHTSELQSQSNLVCRLLLEKKKKKKKQNTNKKTTRK